VLKRGCRIGIPFFIAAATGGHRAKPPSHTILLTVLAKSARLTVSASNKRLSLSGKPTLLPVKA
jgi:hypothetical protein